MDRVYYTTKYVKDMLHKFLNVKEDPKRDRLLGSPLLPYPLDKQNDGYHLLVMLPSLKREQYDWAFAHEEYFRFSIRRLSTQHDLILKTRPKQWFHREIKRYVKEVITDTYKMYPPPTWKAFEKSHTTMMYCSSGIFEAVCAGNYVVNVPISLKRYRNVGSQDNRLQEHFSNRKGSLYNYKGVVESVRLCNILNGKWKLNKKIDLDARQQWIDEFVGPVYKNSAKEIVDDIIGD
jgi:hypothetical protein